MKSIIAIGGGGYRIADDIINHILEVEELILFDTDKTFINDRSKSASKCFLLRDNNDLIARNKKVIVNAIKDVKSSEVIVAACLGGFTGTNFVFPIALAAALMGKSVSVILTLPFTFEGDKPIVEAHKAAARYLWWDFNLVIIQNNSQLPKPLKIRVEEINFPIIETLRNILRRFDLSELPLYEPKMGVFHPKEYSGSLTSFICAQMSFADFTRDIKYWMEVSCDDIEELKAIDGVAYESNLEAITQLQNHQNVRFSIAEEVAHNLYGNGIPTQINEDLKEMRRINTLFKRRLNRLLKTKKLKNKDIVEALRK